MSELSDDARSVAAAWFGAGRVGSTLRFHMVQSKPSERSQAGLDELVAAGILSVETEPRGAVVYTALVPCTEHLAWATKRLMSDNPPEGFRLVDRIDPNKKPLKRAGTMTVRRRPSSGIGGVDGR